MIPAILLIIVGIITSLTADAWSNQHLAGLIVTMTGIMTMYYSSLASLIQNITHED